MLEESNKQDLRELIEKLSEKFDQRDIEKSNQENVDQSGKKLDETIISPSPRNTRFSRALEVSPNSIN